MKARNMYIQLRNYYAASTHHGMGSRPCYLAREWVGDGHNLQIVATSQTHTRSNLLVLDAAVLGNDPVGEAGCGLAVTPEASEAVVAAIHQLGPLISDKLMAMARRERRFILSCHTSPVQARRLWRC